MAGIVSFGSLESAIRAGYHVVDRTQDGFLVAKETPYGKAMAVVAYPLEWSRPIQSRAS